MARVPYVSVAEFTAYPQFLDLNDLITGGNTGEQNDELNNVLLRASGAADDFIRGGLPYQLGARTYTETRTLRVHRDGTLHLAPRRRPYIPGSLANVSLVVPGLTPLAVTDLTGVIDATQDEGRLYVPVFNQTGVPYTIGVGSQVVATYTYAAGYLNAILTAPTATTSPLLTVDSAVGAYAGLDVRIVDPPVAPNSGGTEEWLAVSSVAGNVITATTNPTAVHTAGTAVSAVPQGAKTAVILWAMGLLMRPASGGSDDPFADATDSPTTNTKAGSRPTGRGLIRQAKQMLLDGGYPLVGG